MVQIVKYQSFFLICAMSQNIILIFPILWVDANYNNLSLKLSGKLLRKYRNVNLKSNCSWTIFMLGENYCFCFDPSLCLALAVHTHSTQMLTSPASRLHRLSPDSRLGPSVNYGEPDSAAKGVHVEWEFAWSGNAARDNREVMRVQIYHLDRQRQVATLLGQIINMLLHWRLNNILPTLWATLCHATFCIHKNKSSPCNIMIQYSGNTVKWSTFIWWQLTDFFHWHYSTSILNESHNSKYMMWFNCVYLFRKMNHVLKS